MALASGPCAGKELTQSLVDAVSTVKDLVSQGKLSKDVIAGAKGLVFLTSTKVGLGMSADAGRGFILSRLESGSWSGPSPLVTTGVGFGAVLGYEEQRTLIALGSQEDVDLFTHEMGGGKVALGLGGTIGTTGASGALNMVPKQLKEAKVFTLSKGVLLDASLAGTAIDVDFASLRDCYGHEAKPAAILSGKVPPPPEAQELYDTLKALMEGH